MTRGIVTDLRGRRFGRLVAIEVLPRRSRNRHALWLCVCDCGAEVTVFGNNLLRGNTRSCGCYKRDTLASPLGACRAEVVGYFGAHDRVDRDRGAARDYACVDCGNVADQWSYDHRDDNERAWEPPDGAALVYSLESAHYEPRCRGCHAKFDMDHHRTNGAGS